METSTASSRTFAPSLLIFMVLALWILPTGETLAKTILVPEDYPTIQLALDAAQDGDQVLVAPGVYQENIVFPGLDVSLVSETGPNSTTIKGNPLEEIATVQFLGGETRDTLIQGFTITSGHGGGILCKGDSSPRIIGNVVFNNIGSQGGGIVCDGSSPLIEDNEINSNYAFDQNASSETLGGGINALNAQGLEIRNNVINFNHAQWGAGINVISCSPLIEGNTIEHNLARREGGGINLKRSDAEVSRNRIAFNRAIISGGGVDVFLGLNGVPFIHDNLINHNYSEKYGGGINLASDARLVNNMIVRNQAVYGGAIATTFLPGGSNPEILHCTLSENSASESGGGIWFDGYNSVGTVRNSILWSDEAPLDAEIHVETGGAVDVTYSDVEGGHPGSGNIDGDPLFVDPSQDDWHIPFNSPCRSAADRTAPGLPDTDFEGDPRIGLFVFPDMGADEFYTHLYLNGEVYPGRTVECVVVGWPKSNPVVLISGSGVLSPPMPTPYGDFLLMPPWKRVHLDPIPDDGVLRVSRTVTNLLPPGTEVPLQALVGTDFTNLYMVEIRPR